MALIQGGPPEWVWERPPSLLKWEVAPSQAGNGQPVYELRLNCHLEIMRLHFFTEQELQDLQVRISEALGDQAKGSRVVQEPGRNPSPEPVGPNREAGNRPDIPETERVPRRAEGTVSDPDFSASR
jgi:hypothetical protein